MLVLSFNVTLANHLRSLVIDRCAEYGTNPTRVTCTNFHSLCTRIVQDAARMGIEPAARAAPRWNTAIVKKTEGVLSAGNVPRYDAYSLMKDKTSKQDGGICFTTISGSGGEMLLVSATPRISTVERPAEQ